MQKAIIFGASGLTGSSLLQLLCNENYYDEVICFVRKQIHVINNKQINVLTDFGNLEQFAEMFTGADVYCCLGTTNKNVNNNKDAYREADLFRPMRIALLCKNNGGNQFLIISALGASANSKIFYNRLKGELQDKLIAMQLPGLNIFQPSLLLGNRHEKRSGERFGQVIAQAIKPFLSGRLKKYRAIHVDNVALGMFIIAKKKLSGNHIYASNIIQQIADAG